MMARSMPHDGFASWELTNASCERNGDKGKEEGSAELFKQLGVCNIPLYSTPELSFTITGRPITVLMKSDGLPPPLGAGSFDAMIGLFICVICVKT